MGLLSTFTSLYNSRVRESELGRAGGRSVETARTVECTGCN